MFEDHSVAVVVPARDEQRLLPLVLAGLPPWVDAVFVVDDASRDATAEVTRRAARRDPRVRLVRQARRQGVGGAIAEGYRVALSEAWDLVAVMAGDNQMDPADLPRLLTPLVQDDADYVKGDRFAWPDGPRRIPPLRRLGNRVLSALTGWVTGHLSLSDSQCGYTAISHGALQRLDPATMYRGYGYPNDVLARLTTRGARVSQVPVRPRYGIGERSKLRIPLVILPITWILLRAALWRLKGRRRTDAVTGRTSPSETPSLRGSSVTGR